MITDARNTSHTKMLLIVSQTFLIKLLIQIVRQVVPALRGLTKTAATPWLAGCRPSLYACGSLVAVVVKLEICNVLNL